MKKYIALMGWCIAMSLANAQPADSLWHSHFLVDSVLNDGNLQNPLLTFQGLMPGVIMTRPGADLNEDVQLWVRGFGASTGFHVPLIIIDGIPAVSELAVDPDDIASVRLVTGPEAARWGLQGGSGVLLITTKAQRSPGFRVDYHSYYSLEKGIQKVYPYTWQEFLAMEGNDLGERHNWMKQITRPAHGMNQHLAVSGGTQKVQVRAGINYRNFEGILETTDQRRLSGSLAVGITPLKSDALRLDYRSRWMDESANVGKGAAFHQAYVFNPTFPIRFPSGTLADTPYLYNQFSPVALLLGSSRVQQRNVAHHSLRLSYALGRWLLTAQAGVSSEAISLREDHSSYLQHWRWGRFFYEDNSLKRQFLAAGMTKSWGRSDGWHGAVEAGFQAQRYATSYWMNHLMTLGERERAGTLGVAWMAYSLNAEIHKGRFSGYITNRREGATSLGLANRYGWLWSATSTWDLTGYIPFLEKWRMSLGHGRSGMVPYDSGAVAGDGNEQLTYQKFDHTEVKMLMGINDRLSVEITRFQKNVSDIFDLPQGLYSLSADPPYTNDGAINNSGWELVLSHHILSQGPLRYRHQWMFTHLKTRWKSLPRDTVYFGSTPYGYASTTTNAHVLNQSYGTHFGGLTNGLDASGNWQMQDLSGDGTFSWREDWTVLGQPLPKWTIGWQQNLSYKGWKLDMLWRGAFGHSISNSLRLHYQYVPYDWLISNGLPPEADVPLAVFNQWSNQFVEKASFARLEYVTLAYQPKLNAAWPAKRVEIYFTANQLVTLTPYRGNDPEVRLATRRSALEENRSFRYQYLSAGMDELDTWLPARSYVLGVRVAW